MRTIFQMMVLGMIGLPTISDVSFHFGTIGAIVGILIFPVTYCVMPIFALITEGNWMLILWNFVLVPVVFGGVVFIVGRLRR